MNELIEPVPLMTLERVCVTMKNTKHLAQSLLKTRIQRYYFDAENTEDRLVYLVFLETGKWIKQYYFEIPDLSVVAMIQRKLIKYALRNEAEKAKPIINDINAHKPTIVAY